MTSTLIQLDQLSQLTDIFRQFSNGKHICRMSDPVLWAELEREEEAYRALFSGLGYELRMDGRGFAWFHTHTTNSSINKTTRQLALLFMVIFDTQADSGKPLLRFSDWVLDKALLTKIHEQHQELLLTEEINTDGMLALLESATRLGFARQNRGHWQLLPSVCRYLDHFEALASVATQQIASSEDIAFPTFEDDAKNIEGAV